MSALIIRELRGQAEYRACVALQRLTWGEDFSESVPPSILMVAQEVGGVAAGAFDGDRLLGFVFGITGWRDGQPLHWSDMLAVHPEARGRGLGLALKVYQREALLRAGVRLMRWTFDPLVVRNAHLNLNRLGATVAVYRRDVYGESDSTLHAGLGTDRLVADWALDSERVERRISGDDEADRWPTILELPLCNPPTTTGELPAPSGRIELPGSGVDAIRIVAPSDIMALRGADPELAVRWRRNLRASFEPLLEMGFRAVALGEGEEGLASYVLTRTLRR